MARPRMPEIRQEKDQYGPYWVTWCPTCRRSWRSAYREARWWVETMARHERDVHIRKGIWRNGRWSKQLEPEGTKR